MSRRAIGGCSVGDRSMGRGTIGESWRFSSRSNRFVINLDLFGEGRVIPEMIWEAKW